MPLVFKECVIFSDLFLTPVKHFAFFPSEVSCSSPCKCCGDVQKANWPHPWVPTPSPEPKPQGYLEPSLNTRQIEGSLKLQKSVILLKRDENQSEKYFHRKHRTGLMLIVFILLLMVLNNYVILSQAFTLPCTSLAYLQNCEAVYFKGPWQRIKKTICIGHQA